MSQEVSIAGPPKTVSLAVKEVPVEAVVEVASAEKFTQKLPQLVFKAHLANNVVKSLPARYVCSVLRFFYTVYIPTGAAWLFVNSSP